jgi:hypothetical protein
MSWQKRGLVQKQKGLKLIKPFIFLVTASGHDRYL